MNKKRIIIVIILILSAALIGILGFILFKNINNMNSKDKYNQAASSYANFESEAESTAASTAASQTQKPTEKAEKNPIDFASLQNRNPDIYAWIKMNDTNINYPVVQSPKNDIFYLDHDLDGNYAFAGSIYSQLCNSRNFQDRVTVLYGHNMLDGSMFADIYKLADQDFFNSTETFTIYTPDNRLDYTIVSVFEYDDRHIMNSYNFSDDSDYQSFIDEIMKPRSVTSMVRKGEKLTTNDKIVVLSTCVNYGEGRFLAVGKLKKQTKLK